MLIHSGQPSSLAVPSWIAVRQPSTAASTSSSVTFSKKLVQPGVEAVQGAQ